MSFTWVLLLVVLAAFGYCGLDGYPSRLEHRATDRTPTLWVGYLGVLLLAVFAVLIKLSWVLWIGWASMCAVTGVWLGRRILRYRESRRNQRDVARLCAALAGQLGIGELPRRALSVVAADCELLVPVAQACEVGADYLAVLRTVGARPGCLGLAELADGWTLSERTGMPLGPIVAQVAELVVTRTETELQREAELASARATGRLLAVLPVAGIALGFMVGADPIGFLSGGWFGQLCVIGATALVCGGLVWTERLATGER